MSFQHRTAAEMEEDTEAAKVAMRKLKIEANAALKAELSGKGGAKIIKKKMVEKGKAFGARKKIDGGGAAAAAADAGADASDGGEGEAAEGAGVVDVPEAAASVAESGAAAGAAAEGGAAEEDDVLEEDDYERVIEMDDREEDGDDDEDDDVDVADGEGGGAAAEDAGEVAVEDNAKVTFTQHGTPAFAIAIHPGDSTLVASGGEDDNAYIWSSETGEVVTKIEGHEDSVIQVEFNRDGSMLATGGMDGIIKIWKTVDGAEVCELDCGDDLRWIQWHPVANFIIAATESGSVHMWDVPGANMSFYTGHGGAVTCGGWSPDGRNFVTGSVDGTIIQWSPKTGAAINKMHGQVDKRFHQAPLTCLSWHPEGGVVVTGDEAGMVCVTHPKNGKVLGSFQVGEGHLEAAALSGSPTLVLVAASLDGSLQVWNTMSGGNKVMTGHTNHVLGFSKTKDDTKIATCSEDGTCKVFDVTGVYDSV
eukprot:gene6735-2960_t